ncbi:protein TIFY 10b-like [Primulina eburnea]|uniref:protein TIFY 10b-like n=1 Tax=Primulina eburnea TaxID=1245227 RepID=UPI003C6CAD88
MGSAEIVDSGRFSSRRSTSFSQTCSLLSQYLKEKGTLGELAQCLNPNFESKGTMNLLPMIEKSDAKEETLKKPEAETAQMTIFYAGQVIVFNDFPADKAKDVMVLASNSCATKNRHSASVPPPHTAQFQAESATRFPNIVRSFGIPERTQHTPDPPLGSDLPIARKNSLARFLEKRKDRITENAPYQAAAIKPVAAATAKPPTAEAWLGLGNFEFQCD